MSEGKKRTLSEAHKRKLLNGRKKKIEARARAEAKARRQQLREEARSIGTRIAKAEKEYDQALARALRAKGYVEGDWEVVERRQQILINLLARQRLLQRELER